MMIDCSPGFLLTRWRWQLWQRLLLLLPSLLPLLLLHGARTQKIGQHIRNVDSTFSRIRWHAHERTNVNVADKVARMRKTFNILRCPIHFAGFFSISNLLRTTFSDVPAKKRNIKGARYGQPLNRWTQLMRESERRRHTHAEHRVQHQAQCVTSWTYSILAHTLHEQPCPYIHCMSNHRKKRTHARTYAVSE